jgi:hypothetical protein
MPGFGIPAVVVLVPSTGEIGGTWGSSGVANRKLHGLTDQTFSVAEQTEALPMVGYYGPSPVNEETQQSGEFSMSGVYTYQEAPKLLNGFFAGASTSTGAADPFPYYYAAPTASTQACFTYCLEFGTTGVPYKSYGSIFNSLNITGEAGSLWKFSVDGFSKQIAVSSGLSTAAFADQRAMTPVAMKDTEIYLNPLATGAYASSSGVVSAALISFNLTYNPNRHLKFFAGSKYPQSWGDDRNEGTLQTVLEFSSQPQALLAELIANSASLATSSGLPLQKQITLKALHNGTASTWAAQIDFAGIVSEPIQMWTNRDGNCTVELTWSGKFSTALTVPLSSTVGNYLGFTVFNGSSSTT